MLNKLFSWGTPPGLAPGTIRTYTREQPAQPVDLASLASEPEGFSAPKIQTLQDDQLAKTLRTMRKNRLKELNSNAHATRVAPAVAKDPTLNPSAYYMAYDSIDNASLGFIAQMAEVGRHEDFHVVANCEDGEDAASLLQQLPEKAAQNVTTVVNPGCHDTWAEDHGEYTTAGEMIVPAPLPSKFDVDAAIDDGRMRRFYNDKDSEPDSSKFPLIEFSRHGRVGERRTYEEAVAGALSTGAKNLKMAGSYVEGGNFMPGRKPDGTPFALVGQDSVAVTRQLLRHEGHKRADQRDAVRQIARDYGLQPNQVIAVEQPGEFHIDMAMALVGPGKVILNDARAVADLQQQWITQHYDNKWFRWGESKQLRKTEEQAERLAVYEDMVENDLRKAGLEVYRIPGVFPATSANSEMNFFNLRQGRNEKGEEFAIAMGGDERAEQMFAATMLGGIPTGYQRVHFLDRELTPLTLDLSGGIKCRSKGREDIPA
jgi:hypothetical protein